MRETAAALIVLAVASAATDARADDKKICTDAYVGAQTLRDEHHLLAERDQLQLCARSQCSSLMRGQMVKDCTAWLAQVEAAIPTIVFDAKDGDGNDLSAVRVTMDGQALADKLDGTSLAVDPGEHHFTFDRTDGSAHAQMTVVAHEADKDRHIRVVVGRRMAAVSDSGAGSSAPEHPQGAPTGAYVALGVAGVGLIAGGVFTGVYVAADSQCPDQKCPSGNAAPVAQWGVGIGFGVAVVAAVIGVVLLAGAPGDVEPTRASALEPRLRAVPAGVAWTF